MKIFLTLNSEIFYRLLNGKGMSSTEENGGSATLPVPIAVG
jgi:hypothetical protein